MSAEEQARVAARSTPMSAVSDAWDRRPLEAAQEVVSHMVDRLNEPESRFHATMVTNVFDLVELLPRLNVNGDADLNRFAIRSDSAYAASRPRTSRGMICCAWQRQRMPQRSSLRSIAFCATAKPVRRRERRLHPSRTSWPHVYVHGGAAAA